MKKTLVLLVALLSSNIVQAQFYDGNELFKWSKEKENPNGSILDTGMYYGYLSSIVDSRGGVSFCPPAGITLGQVTDIVTNYLKNNPEKRHQPADILVVYAMRESFPCKD